MATIFALVLGRTEQVRIDRALQEVGSVQFCELRAELARAARTPYVSAIVTELFDRDGAPVTPALHVLRDRLPGIPVIVYMSLAMDEVRALASLATAVSVNEVVLRNLTGAGATIRSALRGGREEMPIAATLSVCVP